MLSHRAKENGSHCQGHGDDKNDAQTQWESPGILQSGYLNRIPKPRCSHMGLVERETQARERTLAREKHVGLRPGALKLVSGCGSTHAPGEGYVPF